MIFDPDPFATVMELVSRSSSGELICASDTVEVHVYFQRGRIAWATDASRPLAFTRRLVEAGRVDVDVLRELLESCRRERRPLGETLIAWGLVTRDDVRDALLHQIRLAFDRLREPGPVQTLFLNRALQFASYDAELTFELEDVLAPTPSAPARPSSIRPDSVRPGAAVPPRAETPDAEAAHVRASLDGLLWIESDDASPGACVADGGRVPPALARRTLLDGATLVALSTDRGVLAGVVLPSRRTLWCFTGQESTIGAVVATLVMLGGAPTAAAPGASSRAEGAWWSFRGGDDDGTLDLLRNFAEQAPEVHAPRSRSGRWYDVRVGRGRGSRHLAGLSPRARRRWPMARADGASSTG